jgi:predicted permease
MLMLGLATALVLLAGCASFVGLSLARWSSRVHDLSIRIALGAQHSRVLWNHLVQSALLGIAGGAVGLVLTMWALRLVLRFASPTLPRIDEVRIDLPVFGFVLTLVVSAGLLAGLVTGLRSCALSAADALRPAANVTAAGTQHVREALVVINVAAAVTLLTAAGLLSTSAWRMHHVELGFDPRGVLLVDLELPTPDGNDGETRTPAERAFADRLRRIPEVTGAALASNYPFAGGSMLTATLGDSRECDAAVAAVDPAYFSIMQIPLLVGRSPRTDDSTARTTMQVSREFVRRCLQGAEALGTRVMVQDRWWEIDGVVGDTAEVGGVARGFRWKGLTASAVPWVYLPSGQDTLGRSTVVLKTSASASVLASVLRAAAAEASPFAAEVSSLDRQIDRTLADTRFLAILLASFAAVASLLAAAGVHAVVAFAVSQRTREIGIRQALGASPGRMWRLVVGRVAVLVAFGMACGGSLGWFLQSIARGLLFDAGNIGLSPILVVIGVFVVVAIAAVLAPTLRAVRMEPRDALRAE